MSHYTYIRLLMSDMRMWHTQQEVRKPISSEMISFLRLLLFKFTMFFFHFSELEPIEFEPNSDLTFLLHDL